MQLTPNERRARIRREAGRVKNGFENLAVEARDTTLSLVETGLRWLRMAVDEVSQEIRHAQQASRHAR
jgi:hypothetical protein